MAGQLKTTGARLIPITLAFLALPACDLFGEPVAKGAAIDGQALETSTDKPISGAIVVATWSGIVGSLAHSQGVCFHVESATTDEQGRYHIPAWQKTTRFARAKHQVVAIVAFKQGYSFVEKRAGNTLHLKPFTGTREERFDYLSRSAISCSDRREIEINLLPLYKALYEEARTLAVTKEQKLKALYRLRDVERLELGSDQAWENFRQRQRELQ